LVLAAPLTLALRAAPAPYRRRVHRLTRHPAARTLGHPVAGLALFGGTLVALYFTPLYELSLRNDLVHVWLHLHLFVAGVLLVWPLIGAEPLPVRTSHMARLLAVVVAVPFHAFVSVALMTATRPLALDWYQEQTGRSASEILADQRLGAGLLWVSGELLSVVIIGVVVMRWVVSEQRIAERREALQPAGGGP
jgi:putative copper resistance protein D